MRKFVCASLIATICIWSSSFALAQKGLGKSIVIPDGTEISAVTTETLSSKTAQEDDPITFRVDEDVIIDGSVVIAKGTLLKGVVSRAKKSGFFGRGGELSVRVESTTTVDGQKLKVRQLKAKQAMIRPELRSHWSSCLVHWAF